MKRLCLLAVLTLASAGTLLRAQVAPSAYSDTMPDQITVAYQSSQDDYSLQTGSTLTRTRLSGINASYVSRRFYPFELLGSTRYSSGNPLNQKLLTIAGGIGYTRQIPYAQHWFERGNPFVDAQFGISRTSSNQLMYLYTSSHSGLTEIFDAGIDIPASHHWAVRPIYFERQNLPFGSIHSVYRNYGAGIAYRFHFRGRFASEAR